MVHLRIVAPPDRADRVHALLCATPSAIDVIRVEDASTRPDGDLDHVRRRARGRERDHLRAARAGTAPGRVDLAQPGRHDLRLRGRRARPRARLAVRRRDLGATRPAHERERRAVGRLPALHGAGRDHRRDRDLPRQRDPGRGRDGRRPRVRTGRGPVRRAGPAAPESRQTLRHGADHRLPARDRRHRRWPRWPSTRSTSSRTTSTSRSTSSRAASRARTRSPSSWRSARERPGC